MRIHRLALLAVALSALRAEGSTRYFCTTATVKSFSIAPDRTALRFNGRFTPPAGFNPLVFGLTIDLVYEPETDPANVVHTVTIPGTAFEPLPAGVRYRDRSGSLGGVRFLRITDVKFGVKRVVLKGNGSMLGGVTRAGSLRLVLTADGGCVRTCGSPCTLKGARLSCTHGRDTTLCGTLSGCELLNVTEGQPLGGGDCLLPYPSSFFEEDDPSTVTGKRLSYRSLAMPANTADVHIDPTPWNTLDGFGPGTIITVHFRQGVDLTASHVPSLTDFAASVALGSPTILVEADSAGCVPVEHFGENDVSIGVDNATPVAPPDQVFMIRPGRRLRNGTRYIVALRGLVGQDGQPIQPATGFQALRDGTPSGSTAIEARRAHFDTIFDKLAHDCGVARAGLVLAWDFTVASDDAIERWLLHMRDDTFAQLGASPPAFTVTSIEDDPFGDPRVCRRVRGTYTVPLYTTFDGPGSVLNIDPMTNLPVQTGVASDVPFTVMIPCSLVSPIPQAGRPIFYGHGLLGTGFGEVTADHLRTLANTYGFVVAATDWQGFSAPDVPTILGFINDLSGFRKLPERLHQGILNQLVLAHLLIAPGGLADDPALNFGGVSVIDPSEVFYYGNSQGGIEGGVVMALSTEALRGVLGVAAANYSTLLQRSVDFAPYFAALKTAYPDDIQRAMTYPLLQQLWDRAEPNGWYHHTVSDPLPGTPAHKTLVHMATNDAEVANIGTEIMVRSMGIPQVSPVVRHYFGIGEMPAPFDGSAMVESDEGDPPVPITNVPPPSNGAHGAMRARPAIQAQIDQFLRTGGQVQNFCTGACDPE